MANNIGGIRAFSNLFLLNDGKIDAKEAKALVDMANVGSKEDIAQNRAAVVQMFRTDAFDSGVDRKKLLGQLGANASNVKLSPMVGKAVGNTTVIRTFGPPEGYSNKFQAIAKARADGGGVALAVVKDPKTQQWHAVQTKAELSTTDIDKAFPLKPDAAKYQQALSIKDPAEQAKQLAMYGLGVPADLVNVGNGPGHFDKNKLNINLQETTANGKAHVHDSDCTCGKNGAALEIAPGRLKQGAEFITSTLMHEAKHVADDDLLVSALKTWGKTLDRSAPAQAANSVDAFKGWVRQQKGFTDVQKATLKGMAGHVDKQVEGSAYLAAFSNSIGTNREAALDQLLGFADYEKRAIGNMPNGNEMPKDKPNGPTMKNWHRADENRIQWQVREQKMKELRAVYDSLPADQQQDFKLCIAIAEKKYQPYGAKLWSELFPNDAMPTVTGNEIPTGNTKYGNDYR